MRSGVIQRKCGLKAHSCGNAGAAGARREYVRDPLDMQSNTRLGAHGHCREQQGSGFADNLTGWNPAGGILRVGIAIRSKAGHDLRRGNQRIS